jgi:hypothetical protein
MTKHLRQVTVGDVDTRTALQFSSHGFLSTQAWLFDEGDAVVWLDAESRVRVTIRIGDRITTLLADGVLSAMRAVGVNTDNYSKVVW